MSSSLIVRRARREDVAQIARVDVQCWQETYRGLKPDTELDDSGFLVARERFWNGQSKGRGCGPVYLLGQ